MTTPRDPDQPDHYTGSYTMVTIRWLYLDDNNQTLHLVIGNGKTGTYCTHGNEEKKWQPAHGWERLGFFIDPGVLRSRGRVYPICRDCLCLARVDAEMTGQRQYKIRGLMQQF